MNCSSNDFLPRCKAQLLLCAVVVVLLSHCQKDGSCYCEGTEFYANVQHLEFIQARVFLNLEITNKTKQ